MRAKTATSSLGAIVCGFIVMSCSASFAKTIRVTNNGTGEYPTIQAAINASVSGDTVLVAPGTYTGDGNRDIDFGGKAITVRSETGPGTCIIDAQGSFADRHRGFNFHMGEQADSVLDGFTITGGYQYPGEGGGAPVSRAVPRYETAP
ncbi:MAG TPA: hypothetical protein PKH24_12395 [Sedimentisphaerales bacterium]|jgi:hypothetical protein|nr:hypothetical protein [Sedimentisphaerales bacterium]HNU30073.1 hypothetical protein [Sedimentisphaerales bacterium]